MSQNRAVEDTQDENQIEGLRPGAKLLRGQYEILSFLSNGGFGITYLARDSLDRDVVIKECYPGALCRRNGDLVEAVDPAYDKDLRSIIDLFIQEARNHARLVHPNIVDVHQVFEDNQTAYIAMDLIRGCDLLDFVQDSKNESSPDFIVQVTEKMLSAVSFIHDSGMLHRDISPDNILIDENKQPVLIDFGAAREQAANKSAALLTLRVIKDGYSPHEFYVRGAEQGPSSDLYVLAATLYHTISGERPIDGQTRLDAFNNSEPDPYVAVSGRIDGYPDGFLEAIDKAMEVHVPDRLQTALDWLRMFRGKGVVFDNFSYRPVSVIVAVDREEEEELSEAEQKRIQAETENAEAVVNALLSGSSELEIEAEHGKSAARDKSASTIDTVVHSDASGNGKVIAGVAAAVVALAAGGYFAFSGGGDDASVTTDVAVAPATVIEVTPEEVVTTAETETTPDDAASVTDEEAVVVETEVAAVEEVVVAEEPVVSEVIVDEPAAVETTEAAPVEDATISEEINTDAASGAEPAVEETVSVEAAVAIAEPVELLEEQVAFSHWDVDIPFQSRFRKVSNANAIAITGVTSGEDLSVVGEWVKRGAVIYTLNGEPIRRNIPLESLVLRNHTVDSDGYIRVVVRYRPMGEKRVSNGLLAMPAVQVSGLENGVTLAVRSDSEKGWRTEVRKLSADHDTSLRVGDILVQETVTGTDFDAQDSLEKALDRLMSQGRSEMELVITRNGIQQNASMPLVTK
ncbi:serine/threonine-protein kinase [Roseovarius sp. EL26]|uniref:serine/threonine-protein kinase n=1 Tax=Roseovarius sp. EL26 TaxID=2126672 RepID=UPI000EA10EF5|nr:serine/threonine-protein kinase [Roseovarius sp. EL26]